MIENIAKKLKTYPPLQAAFLGINEIGFSVLSISIVLLCVFIPISYMNSISGLFFQCLRHKRCKWDSYKLFGFCIFNT